MATVRSFKADVSSVSPISERMEEEITLETSGPIYVIKSVDKTKLPFFVIYPRLSASEKTKMLFFSLSFLIFTLCEYASGDFSHDS